jgi:hypothetical protein
MIADYYCFSLCVAIVAVDFVVINSIKRTKIQWIGVRRSIRRPSIAKIGVFINELLRCQQQLQLEFMEINYNCE